MVLGSRPPVPNGTFGRGSQFSVGVGIVVIGSQFSVMWV